MKSVMRPGFYVSQCTAHETTQMQYTSWLHAWCRGILAYENCLLKSQMWYETLLSSHFVSLQQMGTPSQLSPRSWRIQFLNFLHIHLLLMWRACQSNNGKCRMNYISEWEPSPFILCMMPKLLPCTETTWKHLLVGTNVLHDKDQGNLFIGSAAKDKTPSEQESRINYLALKENVWSEKAGANRSR